jgi:hypothetical protein
VSDDELLIDVALEAEAPPGETEAVRAIFEQAGVRADVTASVSRLSVGDLPWVVYATLPLQAFLVRLAQNAADDAPSALKKLVANLMSHRKRSTKGDGAIVFRTDEGPQIVVGDGLPDAAFEQFVQDIPRATGGYYLWDAASGRWVNRLRPSDRP